MTQRVAAAMLRSARVGGCVALLLVAAACRTPPPPAPPPPAYWPTQGWRTSVPEAQGVDSEQLAQVVDLVRERGLAVDSLLIVRHGYVVLDAYFYPYSPGRLHDLASVTKSVTATLAAIAIEAGLIGGFDTPVATLLPEAASGDARKARITIRDLLSMSSGLQCGYAPGEAELRAMLDAPDWSRFVLDLPMATEPGRAFAYCSGNSHLLSALISRRAGTSALEFARARLFAPLGIRDAVWPVDPQGLNRGWGDLRLHPRDLAKLGFLYLHRGRWEDRQIVSADWVERATRAQRRVPAYDADYGLGWWVLKPPYAGLYEARGRGGQFVTVVPAGDVVAVFTGGFYDRSQLAPLLMAAIQADQPLPDNPAGRAHLERSLAAAARAPAPLAVPALPARAREISGRIWRFDPNPPALESFVLRFNPTAEARLTLVTRAGRFDMPVGLDGVYRFSEVSPSGQAAGLKGTWLSEREFVLRYDEIAGPNSFLLHLDFAGDDIRVRLDDPTGMWSFAAQARPEPAAPR